MLASTLSRPRWAMPMTDLVQALADRLVEQGVEDDDGRLGALEPEALLAHVAGVQEALEHLGGVEPVEDVALLVRSGVTADTPSTCCWIQRFCSGSWMCMYSTPERPAVGVAQDVRGSRRGWPASLPARPSATNVPGQVPDGEPVVERVELGVEVDRLGVERVEVGDEVAAHPVHVDQGLDVVLLDQALVAAVARRRPRSCRPAAR